MRGYTVGVGTALHAAGTAAIVPPRPQVDTPALLQFAGEAERRAQRAL